MENASLKLHGLHFSTNICVTITITMRWTRHVASVTKKRQLTKFWLENPDGKDAVWKTLALINDNSKMVRKGNT